MISKDEEAVVKEARELSKKLPKAETKYFLCHIPADPDFVTPFGRGYEDYWSIFTEEQQGYKMAIERIPYFYREDLLKALDISDTDRDSLVKGILK